MKKLCFSAFIAFWSSIATMVAIHALAGQEQPTAIDGATYTLEEIAEHASQDDCWMAIEGKVYDFTDYLSRHPAGPGTMLSWCGREATEGMRTKGYGPDHSDFAWQQMQEYLIGNVE